MKIVNTSPVTGKKDVHDEDEVGTFVKNRVAIYCDRTNAKNMFCFLDGYVAWRVVTPLSETDPEFDQNPQITFHVPPASNLNFSAEDAMECQAVILKDVEDSGITAVQAYPPVWPPRFVIATINSESNSTVSIVFSGNTLPFSEAFDAESIGKKRMKREDSPFPEWYRVCRGIDLSQKHKCEWLLGIFGATVLKHSPCFVRVESFPKEDGAFNTFLTELEQLTNVQK